MTPALALFTIVSAGILSVRDNFWPMAQGQNAALRLQGVLNTTLTGTMLVCVGVILTCTALRWRKTATEPVRTPGARGTLDLDPSVDR